MKFEELQLIPKLLQALHEEGYQEPTPIRQQAIPHVLAGKDLLGLAQTGTGKTAAFALPILQRLAASGDHGGAAPRGGPLADARSGTGKRRETRVLVITPTRELASQVGDSFATYGRHLGFRHTVIFGGVGQRPQEDALRRGVDILIATPGRFLDLANQGFVKLEWLEVFVLDEADRMLDMGFLPDVRRIIRLLPQKRQTLFFSATMPPDANQLASQILKDPARVAVTPPATTVEKIDQGVFFVAKEQKKDLLVRLLEDSSITRALVFTRTKHGADKVVKILLRSGIDAAAIHGNKSQNNRERALDGFKSGRVRVLVATDIAARGIDVEEISHVVNYDLPNVPETYVHRIGRTARAGASGRAYSFCDREERSLLVDIERTIRKKIPVLPFPQGGDGSFVLSSSQPESPAPRAPQQPQPMKKPERRSGGDRRQGESQPRDPERRRGGDRRRPKRPQGESQPRPATADRPPVRLERPANTGGNEPAWSRFSYESTSPGPQRPAGGGGGGGRRGGGGGGGGRGGGGGGRGGRGGGGGGRGGRGGGGRRGGGRR